MDAFDEVIRSEVRRAVDQLNPTADLWLRIQQGLASKRSVARPGLAIAAVAAAVLAVTAALPGPRALATDLMHLVFKLGAVEYTVGSGPVARKVPHNADVKIGKEVHTVTATQHKVQQFTGTPGHFPDQARDAIKGLTHRFRVPDWLPADLSVRVDIAGDAIGTGTYSVTTVLGDQVDNTIFISQLAPAPQALGILTGDAAAKEVTLGKVRALETRTAEGVAYYFNVDGVQISVSGPARQEDALRRMAESLAR